MRICIVAAMARNRVIGSQNRLPWHIPQDLNWFRRVTYNHPVIMGRKTHESIGKILPGRENIIISSRPDYSLAGAKVFHTLDDALQAFQQKKAENIFIIGGQSIFQQALPYVEMLYLTLIHRKYEGDSFFPEFSEKEFTRIFQEKQTDPLPFTHVILKRKQQINPVFSPRSLS